MFLFPTKTSFNLEGDLSVSVTQSDGAKDTRRKSKERERRRSIIQAVSDFFHKKKEPSGSQSPPKVSPGSSHSTKDKFSRFRLNKHKDKGKVNKTTTSNFMKSLSECASFESFYRLYITIENLGTVHRAKQFQCLDPLMLYYFRNCNMYGKNTLP
jgi:hypothetical protein